MVRNVGFDLHAGEILGVAGLVGAGRTELVRLIAGLDQPTGGTIKVKGEVRKNSAPHAMRSGLASRLLPEDRKKEGIVPMRSIASNVALPRLNRFTRMGLIDLRRVRAKVTKSDPARRLAAARHRPADQEFLRRQPAEGHHLPLADGSKSTC